MKPFSSKKENFSSANLMNTSCVLVVTVYCPPQRIVDFATECNHLRYVRQKAQRCPVGHCGSRNNAGFETRSQAVYEPFGTDLV